MTKRYVWADSGVGMSEYLWSQSGKDHAAWVGSDATAQISLMRPTVEEELAFGLEQRGIPTDRMHTLVAHALAQWGLTLIAHRDPSRLSSGQARRVAMASSLLLSPENLFADCPTDGLDREGVQILHGIFDDFTGSLTIGQRVADDLVSVCDEQYELRRDGEDSYTLHSNTAPAVPTFTTVVRREGENPVLAAKDLNIVLGDPDGKDSFTLSVNDLELYPGEIMHLKGLNGTGKTTLMKVLAGLGQDTAQHSTKRRWFRGEKKNPSSLYYTGELTHPDLVGWAPTGLEYSFSTPSVLTECERAVGSTEDSEHIQDILRCAGLEEYQHTHPLDMPSSARRQLTIVLAMLVSEEVIVLDEPTIGLDLPGYAQLVALLQDYCAGEVPGQSCPGSVLFSSHEERFAEQISSSVCELG